MGVSAAIRGRRALGARHHTHGPERHARAPAHGCRACAKMEQCRRVVKPAPCATAPGSRAREPWVSRRMQPSTAQRALRRPWKAGPTAEALSQEATQNASQVHRARGARPTPRRPASQSTRAQRPRRGRWAATAAWSVSAEGMDTVCGPSWRRWTRRPRAAVRAGPALTPHPDPLLRSPVQPYDATPPTRHRHPPAGPEASGSPGPLPPDEVTPRGGSPGRSHGPPGITRASARPHPSRPRRRQPARRRCSPDQR